MQWQRARRVTVCSLLKDGMIRPLERFSMNRGDLRVPAVVDITQEAQEPSVCLMRYRKLVEYEGLIDDVEDTGKGEMVVTGS